MPGIHSSIRACDGWLPRSLSHFFDRTDPLGGVLLSFLQLRHAFTPYKPPFFSSEEMAESLSSAPAQSLDTVAASPKASPMHPAATIDAQETPTADTGFFEKGSPTSLQEKQKTLMLAVKGACDKSLPVFANELKETLPALESANDENMEKGIKQIRRKYLDAVWNMVVSGFPSSIRAKLELLVMVPGACDYPVDVENGITAGALYAFLHYVMIEEVAL